MKKITILIHIDTIHLKLGHDDEGNVIRNIHENQQPQPISKT